MRISTVYAPNVQATSDQKPVEWSPLTAPTPPRSRRRPPGQAAGNASEAELSVWQRSLAEQPAFWLAGATLVGLAVGWWVKR